MKDATKSKAALKEGCSTCKYGAKICGEWAPGNYGCQGEGPCEDCKYAPPPEPKTENHWVAIEAVKSQRKWESVMAEALQLWIEQEGDWAELYDLGNLIVGDTEGSASVKQLKQIIYNYRNKAAKRSK